MSERTGWAGRLGRLAGAAAAAMALLLLSAPGASARDGIYMGLGVSQQDVASGIDGMRTVPNSDVGATQQVRMGKPESGRGIAFDAGFGLNDVVALELLLAVTRHATVFEPNSTRQSFDATLSSVQFGVKLGAPIGDVGEVFVRGGVGGYELAYQRNNFQVSDGQVSDDSRFTGRGYSLGVGSELYFGHWGLQLAYSTSKADLDTVESRGFAGPIKPGVSATISTLILLLNFYLQ